MSGDKQPDATGQLTASWIPGWYELDQTVAVGLRERFYFYEQDQIPVVGGRRFFYYQKDGTRPLASEGVVPQELVFANGTYESSFEVRATITRIYNSEFGEIRGILADGLDYRVVTADGRAFKIEAEEDPGFVYGLGRHLQDQHFIVHLADVERTGETLASRRQATTRDTQLGEDKKRRAEIQALIEPFELVESVESQAGAEASHDQSRPRPARQTKDDRTVEIGVAASGFSNVTTFSFPERVRLGLLLTFRYGFLRWGRWIPAVAGDAIYPDFIRPRKRIYAGWDDWVGYYLLAGNEETDLFLRRFYSRHCSNPIQVRRSQNREMTLDEIAGQEEELRSLIPPHGYFEERAPQVEAAGLPERWQEVFASYLELVDHDSDGLEALARAVFIAWYSYNEPWQLTGIRDLPLAQVAQVLKDLDARMASGSCPPELLSMLRGYGPGLPFDLYPELDSLNRFLNSIEGSYSPDTPLRPMEGRGALGTYWLSRSDVTFR